MSLSVVPKYPFPEKMVKDNGKNSAIIFEKKKQYYIEKKLSLFYL